MSSSVERPIETVSDLCDFLLSEDNDSVGCHYLRGWVSFLAGSALLAEQANAIHFWIRDDPEVTQLIEQVALARNLTPVVVIILLVNQLTVVYQQHDKGDNEEWKT